MIYDVRMAGRSCKIQGADVAIGDRLEQLSKVMTMLDASYRSRDTPSSTGRILPENLRIEFIALSSLHTV